MKIVAQKVNLLKIDDNHILIEVNTHFRTVANTFVDDIFRISFNNSQAVYTYQRYRQYLKKSPVNSSDLLVSPWFWRQTFKQFNYSNENIKVDFNKSRKTIIER